MRQGGDGMAQRSSVITVLMVLAFLLAGYLFYTKVIRQPPQHMIEVVVCGHPGCYHVFEVESSRDVPYKCPRCETRSAYLAYQCQNPGCRAIFGVTPETMESGEKIVCPVCGAQAEVLRTIPRDADALAKKGSP